MQLQLNAAWPSPCMGMRNAIIVPLVCWALQKSNTKYGNEHEAIAVYNMMMGVQKFCPIYTLCVGNAFGEAALLLSAGSPVSWGESLGATVAVTCCQIAQPIAVLLDEKMQPSGC